MSDEEPKVVSVQRIPRETNKRNDGNRELYATVAYHYPQYTLEDAARLPYRDVALLIKMAERIRADNYLTLTQIAAAPHTAKAKGVKYLTDHFKKIMEK